MDDMFMSLAQSNSQIFILITALWINAASYYFTWTSV